MIGIFLPRRSFTIHIPNTGPSGHLFVILTETCDAGENLLVPICSARARYDSTCMLNIGDHDFVKHLSYVDYGLMRRDSAKKLIDRVKSGQINYEGILDLRVFDRICAGVTVSDDAAPIFQNYFSQQVAKLRAAGK